MYGVQSNRTSWNHIQFRGKSPPLSSSDECDGKILRLTSIAAATQTATSVPMLSPLKETLADVPVSFVEDVVPEPSEFPSESLGGIVTTFTSAPSTQEHCETLKSPRS